MRQLVLAIFMIVPASAQSLGNIGIFQGAGDVGNPEQKGAARFDAARGEYEVTGGGANMWEKHDQFQFLWNRATGNAAVTAEVHFPQPSATAHRKAVLVFRQSLETGAPYVDAAIHGNGLIALQFRETENDITRGVRFPVQGPAWVRLDRQGSWFTLFTSPDGQTFQEAGAIQVKLKDPLYVGIGVCSHNPKAVETAVFSHVSLQMAAAAEELPLRGLSHVGIRVSDLEKARAFYGGVIGLDEAFTTRKDDGTVFVACFKVNDRQFIEIFPGLKPDDIIPMTHIAIYTDQLEKLRQMFAARGIKPTEIRKGPRDGSLAFSIRDLPGQRLNRLEFIEYPPDSLQSKVTGKFLSSRRISRHLEHAGIITTDVDAAYQFYVEKLGFRETWRRPNPDTGRVALIHLRIPGASGDYVELSNLSAVTNLMRARAGTAAHFSLEVPDIKTAYQQTIDRGETKDRKEPRFGLDMRWQFNLFDPDGTRVEFMQPRAPGAVPR